MSKVAPWASWAEFHAVYLQLTSSSPSERAQGVKRVETWRTRCRLPVAVDITASFVEIMLNDAYLNPDTEAPRADNELRLMYAMAVIRLVNGIVDRTRQRKSSILERAQGLEWPQFFVDLRHEASHQNLPSLPILRLAAQEAVWLLVERFWRPQLQQIEERGAAKTQRMERVRGSRTLDRRLKALISSITAAGSTLTHRAPKKRKRAKLTETLREEEPEDHAEMKAEHASALVHETAKELSSLAPDEGRLLARLFDTVMKKDPHPDQREAKALQLLCETCSENFALRFMREVLFRAVGLQTPNRDVAPDNCPSLRNICDRFDSEPGLDMEEASPEESEKMMLWLWSLLSLPQPEDAQRSRLQQALRSLLPALRHRMLKQMAGNSEMASRASTLWRALQSESIDDGAGLFASLCEVLDSADSQQEGKEHPREGLLKMEDALRRIQNKESEPGQHPADSWTAVGTLLDLDTLNVVCRQEHSDEVRLPPMAMQTWLDWAATDCWLPSGDISRSFQIFQSCWLAAFEATLLQSQISRAILISLTSRLKHLLLMEMVAHFSRKL
ncbi:unnamed protein product [Durusdinium trenchii]|uniref:Ribosomal biogenesis protein LAS1L n=1 Tax=Durusdinium trenchii TaxID=1381693 RepID=A0ABP0Q5D1_9DINO